MGLLIRPQNFMADMGVDREDRLRLRIIMLPVPLLRTPTAYAIGRALAIASGLMAARLELPVWVVSRRRPCPLW
jgi:hypothetical protein